MKDERDVGERMGAMQEAGETAGYDAQTGLPAQAWVEYDDFDLLAVEEGLRLLIAKLEKRGPKATGDKMLLTAARGAMLRTQRRQGEA
jgi:hypothetical protein